MIQIAKRLWRRASGAETRRRNALREAISFRNQAIETYQQSVSRGDTRDMRRTRQIAIRATVDVLRLENAR